MRKILSTCNFKSSYLAFLIAILLICAIEIWFSAVLPAHFFSHEVDRVLYTIKTKPYQAEYVLLGDSVGRQVLKGYEADRNYAMLATNAAIEMTGQYFLLKRYLDMHPAPKSVIYAGHPSHIDRNLEQVFTENYVLRTFNNFDEIIDIFKVKRDAVQAAKLLMYKIFTSYKYRLHLQKYILGSSNKNIYSGVGKNGARTAFSYRSAGEVVEKLKGKKVSLVHFRELVELLTKKGIPFYYIPMPIKEGKDTKPLIGKNRELFKLLEEWKREGMKITFYDTITEYPEDMFRDTVHFNNKGLLRAKPYVQSYIEKSTSPKG